MTVANIRDMIVKFIKDGFAGGKISWDEAQEMVKAENVFTEGMSNEEMVEKIKALDDGNKFFSPLVSKLLGEAAQ